MWKKKVSKGDSSADGSYSSHPPLPSVCVSLPPSEIFLCVGSCQKVYPIITDSYHYHFLSLWSLPLIQLIKSANVNIHFNLQSCLIGPVEPHCQSSCQRKPNYWQAWQPANQNGRWALLHWPLTVHLFLVFHKVPQTNTSLPSQISTREG